jgi:hypothetical protein
MTSNTVFASAKADGKLLAGSCPSSRCKSERSLRWPSVRRRLVEVCPARPQLPIRPLVNAVVASTRASRGQASRCAANAEKYGFGIACRKQVKKCDMARFPLGQTGGEGIGRRHRRACSYRVPAFQQHVRSGGMGEGKDRIRGDGTFRTPRARQGTWSASPHSPVRGRPARRTRRWTREVRIGAST